LAWDADRDFEVGAVVETAIQQQELLARGDALGLGEDETAELMTPVAIDERYIDAAEEPEDVARVVAFIGLMVTFMLPQIYGQLAMLSVVEEKSSRVVEVLLGHLRPRTLLLGKVIGLCGLASLQLLVITGGLTAALLATDSVDIPASVWQFLPIVLISVLGGLAIYNTSFALLGSLISRQEDAAQIIAPVLIPLMAGFFAAQSVITSGEAGLVAKALTLFPLTAPMLLPVRVAVGTISPGEVVLSLGLLALAVWALIRLAGRVYEFTLLQTGSRIGWAELVRLSRGASLD
jgi:ABC-2 type transport system permease protein